MDDQPEHLTATEARAGSRSNVTRVALGVGLLLVVVIFAALLLVKG